MENKIPKNDKIVEKKITSKYVKKTNKKNNYEVEYKEEDNKAVPLKLSTITATGSVGCFIDLLTFYKNIKIDDINDKSIQRDGFTYIEFGQRDLQDNKDSKTLCKGFHKKMLIHHKSRQEGKRFDNQVTVILRKYQLEEKTFLYQNLKIFSNGNVQMTGLKSIEQGIWVLQTLIEVLKNIKTVDEKAYNNELSFGENALKPNDYSIRLINTDFKVGYSINRRILDQAINRFGLYHSFEAGHYPGVKISFYWNPNKSHQNGLCECDGKNCAKKGKQKDKNHSGCRKITVIVFQSGSVIITGAQSMKQVEDTYSYMTEVLDTLKDEIKKTIVQPHMLKKYPKFSYNDDSTKQIKRIPKGYIVDDDNSSLTK